EYGDYVPNEDRIQKIVKEKYNTEVITEEGRGDSGIAYNLSNGDILKITTNKQEGKIAEYLLSNPHKYIINYKDVWQDGDLYYIIMDKVENISSNLYSIIQQYQELLDDNHIYNIEDAIKIINTSDLYKKYPIVTQEILKYLKHLEQSNINIYDFLNPTNIGIQNNHLVFFDIN
ncbi:MAG: hypothetical protein ACOCRX_01390, partial [Candidatus Woesearchaeota archaeon]